MKYCVKIRFLDGSTKSKYCRARGHGEAIHKIRRVLDSGDLLDMVDYIHKPYEVNESNVKEEVREQVRKIVREQLFEQLITKDIRKQTDNPFFDALKRELTDAYTSVKDIYGEEQYQDLEPDEVKKLAKLAYEVYQLVDELHSTIVDGPPD